MSDRNSRAERPGKKRKPGKYYRPNPLRTAMRFGFAVFAVIFLFSAGLFGFLVYQNWQEEAALRELQQMIQDAPVQTQPIVDLPENPTDGTIQLPTGPVTMPDGMLRKYYTLHEKNPDLYGWISIADTELSYPVMYTPEKPEYYLRRNFERTYSVSGLPFLSEDYFEGCGNTIVYGHNMRNGTMFRTLLSYVDEEFFQAHPVISYDTLYEEGEYEILSVFYSRVFEVQEKNVFRFYYYSDLTDPKDFDKYMTNVKKLSLYDTGVTAEYGDELLTLITCGGAFEEQRFVVVARRIPN